MDDEKIEVTVGELSRAFSRADEVRYGTKEERLRNADAELSNMKRLETYPRILSYVAARLNGCDPDEAFVFAREAFPGG